MGELTKPPAVHIEEARGGSRSRLGAILEQSFAGMYLWHAQRTLRTVRWVRAAFREGAPEGLAMLRMIARRSGYIYYIAVIPSRRATGIGGRLLDDALQVLKAEGAAEALACILSGNFPSIRLFESRGFMRVSFSRLVRSRGFLSAATLWTRMIVAPGEKVFAKALRD
jgi:ribosomal protein S18 acetylase RimI-like enzyme